MVSPIPWDSNAPKATADLIVPWKWAGLGHAEVQRIFTLFGEQFVGAHHDDGIIVLDRNLEVAEVVFLE